MNQVLAIIMAGGAGERLQPLTKGRAKAAVPFGGKFRLIDFTLSNCINSGLRQIYVLTRYLSESFLIQAGCQTYACRRCIQHSLMLALKNQWTMQTPLQVWLLDYYLHNRITSLPRGRKEVDTHVQARGTL